MRIRSRWLGIGLDIGLLLVALTTAYATGSGKGPFVNPDAGQSDAQRNAHYSNLRASFDAHYAHWVANLDVSTINLNSLPHEQMNVLVVPGQPTLQAARSKADRIIIGTVDGLKPTVSGTLVSLSVGRSLKGVASANLTVRQASGLRPTQDWKGVYIADSPGEPLLLPGTRVELFLQISSDGVAEIQSITGMYYLTDSRVKALDLNPFAGSVNGQSESEFAAATAP